MANLQRQLQLGKQLDEFVWRRVREVAIGHFRSAVWALFEELVYTTPQFSGRAAANWNIGINAPDLSVDYGLGEHEDIVPAKSGGSKFAFVTPRQVGDEKWAIEALVRNKPKLREIKGWDQTIYISNAVQGEADTRNGRTSTYYLADLQSPGYWHKRLREANQPYETVSQVLLTESWRGRLTENLVDKEFFQ